MNKNLNMVSPPEQLPRNFVDTSYFVPRTCSLLSSCPRLARTRGFHLNLTTKPRLRRGWWSAVTVVTVTMVRGSGLQQGGSMSYALLCNLHGITTQEVLTIGATLKTPAIKESKNTNNQPKESENKTLTDLFELQHQKHIEHDPTFNNAWRHPTIDHLNWLSFVTKNGK